MEIVFVFTGNHDYYTGDVDNWISYLPSLNVKPLINDRVCLLTENLETCENGIYMAGLEDIETRRFKLVWLLHFSIAVVRFIFRS